MPPFRYIAVSEAGRLRRGVVVAPTRRAAADSLAAEGLHPTRLRAADAGRLPGWLQALRRLRRDRDATAVLRGLADLVGSGVLLVEALDVLVRQTRSRSLRDALETLRQAVSDGVPLADSMASLPAWFDPLSVEMVRAAEESGSLGDGMGRLADYLDRRLSFRASLSAALTYPAIVLCACFAAISFLLTTVVPRIAKILESRKAALPLSTRVVMGAGRFASAHGAWVLVGLGALVALLVFLLNRPGPRRRIHAAVLRVPGFGPLLVQGDLGRFAAAVSSLLKGGVALDAALEKASGVLRLAPLREEILGVAASLREGRSLASAMERAVHFPPMMTSLAAVGERSGSLEPILDRVAASCERDVERSSRRLIAMIEPALILAIAAVVGLVLLSIVRPILEMSNVM